MSFTPITDVKKWYQEIPDKKRWIDVVTAALTVPVLLTVIISNYLNIQSKKNTDTTPETNKPVVSSQPITVTIENPNPSNISTETPIPTPTNSPGTTCNANVPDFEIVSPKEGETVSSDPVCVIHVAQESGFCPVTWSYRINKSSWSPFTDQTVCLYNMADGPVTYELRVRSSESGAEDIYSRNFIYERQTVSPTPTATP